MQALASHRQDLCGEHSSATVTGRKERVNLYEGVVSEFEGLPIWLFFIFFVKYVIGASVGTLGQGLWSKRFAEHKKVWA